MFVEKDREMRTDLDGGIIRGDWMALGAATIKRTEQDWQGELTMTESRLFK
jgi:hypothetical protein